MFRTPVLDQYQTERLAFATYTVFQTVCVPAIGLVVASKAVFAGVQSDPTLPVIHDQGYLVAACGADHTYALAGIPERNVFGTIGADHPDVTSIRAVVNKSCCRIS